MKQKALVMAVDGRRATVLFAGGRFENIRLRAAATVGQEIWVPPAMPTAQRYGFSVAAAVMLMAFLVAVPRFTAGPPVVAAFSLDFTPSINLGVSGSNRVVSVRAFNSAGRRLLRQDSVLGMTAVDAALTLTRSGVADHMVSRSDRYLLLGGAIGSGSGSWFAKITEAEVKMVRDQGLDMEVVVAETHSVPTDFSALEASIGRNVLNSRSVVSPASNGPAPSLMTVLSRSGVLAADGVGAP